MGDFEINDIRGHKDFKGITFSNYKKSEIKKQLLKALINASIEPACHWSIEYICAGHFLELWEIILLFASKHIHLGNPRLSLYLELRFTNFKEIIQNGYVGNELKLRNNPKIRILFAEIICILCLSPKKHNLTKIKIDKNSFKMSNMSEKLKADNVYYVKSVFKKNDPKELFIALNEFAFHIKKSHSSRDACSWLEWILEFDNICKRDKKHNLVAASRYFAPVDSKFSTDFIWIIWEILLETGKKDDTITKIITALINLFSIRYKTGCKRKRRFIIYTAISLVTETVNIHVPIYSEEAKIKTVKDKIHLLYKEIKKNEKKPATDYLFNNSFTGKNNNLEKTIAKLEKMNSMNTIIKYK